jgi:iron complex outermembrane receptor protein
MKNLLVQPLVAAMALACAPFALANRLEVASVQDLADLSLEQLSNIEVTSVSGRAESLRSAAASIFVISAQDIRRSGALTLPEVLRLAPNLQVAQVSAGQYAISARGFNNPIANKLLVLIDGRTVYSPLFSGVFWDANDVMLEDVERVEVISGPGGTLWGANAVNGVINVITRPASATRGSLVSVARSPAGGREAVRHAMAIGADTWLRVYGLAADRDNTRLASGAERRDASTRRQIGFRGDWDGGASQVTLQGELYREAGDAPASNLAADQHGGHLLARWSARAASGTAYTVQGYYDLADRDEDTVFRNRVQTADLQFTAQPRVERGQLLMGGGWRTAYDQNDPTALVLFDPVKRRLSWSNLFAQYQMPVGQRWELTTGLKAERNSYTGLEYLPNLRLALRHSPQSTTWVGLSRVVRAPARIDRDFFFPGRAPFFIAGGPNFRSETANVIELGQRGQVGPALSYSVTAFQQYYKGLRAGIPGRLPAQPENQIQGPARGVEAWSNWQVAPDWQLAAGVSTLRKQLRFTSGASDTASIPNLGNDPSHQWNLRSSWNLWPGSELDVMVRRVGSLPTPQVPAYTAVDARFAVQLNPSVRVALLGRNLLDRRHTEFEPAAAASQLERRWWLQVSLQL